jgi:hypothetical protein
MKKILPGFMVKGFDSLQTIGKNVLSLEPIVWLKALPEKLWRVLLTEETRLTVANQLGRVRALGQSIEHSKPLQLLHENPKFIFPMAIISGIFFGFLEGYVAEKVASKTAS